MRLREWWGKYRYGDVSRIYAGERRFRYFWKHGLDEGYPLCCVFQFAMAIRLGFIPGILFGALLTHGGDDAHIPCLWHAILPPKGHYYTRFE